MRRGDFGGGGMPSGERPDGAKKDFAEGELPENGGGETSFEELDDITRNDADSNTASISSIADFVSAMKTASKNLGAFDQLDGGQGDCALSTEMNLALALENYEGVDSVDFETVWGQGHTQAERTGNSSDNFIDWVNECMK
jgi:hypothetical protein